MLLFPRQGELQSAPTPPAGSQHSCQTTVKLHILLLAWIFPLGSTGARGAAAGIFKRRGNHGASSQRDMVPTGHGNHGTW